MQMHGVKSCVSVTTLPEKPLVRYAFISNYSVLHFSLLVYKFTSFIKSYSIPSIDFSSHIYSFRKMVFKCLLSVLPILSAKLFFNTKITI